MNKHLLLGVLSVTLCYSTTAISQNKNKGQLVRDIVLDKFSKVPIKGALVELLNHSPRIMAISNFGGSFTMQDILVSRQRIISPSYKL